MSDYNKLVAIKKYFPHYTDGVIYPTIKRALFLCEHQPVVPYMWDAFHHRLNTYFGLAGYEFTSYNSRYLFDLRKKEYFLVEMRARKERELLSCFSPAGLFSRAKMKLKREQRSFLHFHK